MPSRSDHARERTRVDPLILMLTAWDDSHDQVLGLEMGADDYVTKPCERRSHPELRPRMSLPFVETPRRPVSSDSSRSG